MPDDQVAESEEVCERLSSYPRHKKGQEVLKVLKMLSRAEMTLRPVGPS